MMRHMLVILGFVAFAPPVAAQEPLKVPPRCIPEVTVHKTACVVTNILKCGDDDWRAISHRRGKPVGVSSYDRDWSFTRWETLGGADMDFSIVPGTGKSMNVRDLLDIGYHEANAVYVINSKILKDQRFRLTGRTEATGETVTVSGEEFAVFRAERDFEREDGESTLNFTLDVLVSMTRDLVIEQNSARAVNDKGWQRFDSEPRAIYKRGDPGFLATVSEFGCE